MIKVMLLFGGQSDEHGISCATAAGVFKALDPEKYQVYAVGISRDGTWSLLDFRPEDYQIDEEGKTAEVLPGLKALTLEMQGKKALAYPRELGERDNISPGREENQVKVSSLDFLKEFQVDVVIPLLHGPYGEDGTLQGLLEIAGVRYVGCGVLSSAACMDKTVTKTILQAAGLPGGKWELVRAKEWAKSPEKIQEKVAALQYPVFVKPARAGSSFGVSRVDSEPELATAIENALKYDPRVIVEPLHKGLEIECAVLEGHHGEEPRTSRPGRILMDQEIEFYDYETKYVNHNKVSLQIPADIPEHLAQKVRVLAGEAFTALQCEGLARVDFFVDVQTEQIVINEINTMPGFTPYSMFPVLWQDSGLSYPQLLDDLIALALERPVGLR